MDLAGFRIVFPEFTAAKYADATVQYWLDLASATLPADRWADQWEIGCYLYAAHNMALGLIAARSGTAAMIASKSVGGVSVSYDVGATTDSAAGEYNATTYGRRFWRMARLVGAGGLQI